MKKRRRQQQQQQQHLLNFIAIERREKSPYICEQELWTRKNDENETETE